MNDLIALRAKHDENVANLSIAKTSLSDVSHELAKAKHELELVKDAPIVSDVLECDECPIFKSDLASFLKQPLVVVESGVQLPNICIKQVDRGVYL